MYYIHVHQQKNSCIAMPHQALQCYFYITSVRTLANVPLSYIRSQFCFSLNLPCNALHPISCPGYTYFTLCPFSMPYISNKYILSLGRQTPGMPRTRSATWGRCGLDRWLLETPGDTWETRGDTRETHRRHGSVQDTQDAQKTPNKPLASRDTSRTS